MIFEFFKKLEAVIVTNHVVMDGTENFRHWDDVRSRDWWLWTNLQPHPPEKWVEKDKGIAVITDGFFWLVDIFIQNVTMMFWSFWRSCSQPWFWAGQGVDACGGVDIGSLWYPPSDGFMYLPYCEKIWMNNIQLNYVGEFCWHHSTDFPLKR